MTEYNPFSDDGGYVLVDVLIWTILFFFFLKLPLLPFTLIRKQQQPTSDKQEQKDKHQRRAQS